MINKEQAIRVLGKGENRLENNNSLLFLGLEPKSLCEGRT